jgi:hypothetical protein
MMTRLAANSGWVVANFFRRASRERRISVGCSGIRIGPAYAANGNFRISIQLYPKTTEKQEV